MRAYSYNKYSNNDLRIINKKNTMNNISNNININKIKINKNRFEEDDKDNNNSNSSSSILEQPSIYTKKSIQRDTNVNNKNRVRSISVNNAKINKSRRRKNN